MVQTASATLSNLGKPKGLPGFPILSLLTLSAKSPSRFLYVDKNMSEQEKKPASHVIMSMLDCEI